MSAGCAERHAVSGGEELYILLPSSRFDRVATVWCMSFFRLTSRAGVLDSPLRRPPQRVLERLTCLSYDVSSLGRVRIKCFFDSYRDAMEIIRDRISGTLKPATGGWQEYQSLTLLPVLAGTTGGWQTKQSLTLLPVLVDKTTASKDIKPGSNGRRLRWMLHPCASGSR